MTPEVEAVRAFVRQLKAVRALVEATYSVTPAGLFQLVSSGQLARTGRVEPDYEYSVHGYGCRFLSDSEVLVDVDFDSQGRERFDAWRIWMYSSSSDGHSDLTREQLDQACSGLSERGELIDHGGGWFSASPDEAVQRVQDVVTRR